MMAMRSAGPPGNDQSTLAPESLIAFAQSGCSAAHHRGDRLASQWHQAWSAARADVPSAVTLPGLDCSAPRTRLRRTSITWSIARQTDR